MTFANNPAYKEVIKGKDGVAFYMPQDIANGYHLSRRIAANGQDIYSASGATKDLQAEIVKQIQQICTEAQQNKSFTGYMDINTLCENLNYRRRYPVDEMCAIRMGAIYLFMDGEDPNDVKPFWTEKKVAMAQEDPELYTFFMTLGAELTPSWIEWSNISTDSGYFLSRRESLRALTPQPSAT